MLLVGGIATPLKNMSSSIGMMTFPPEWKNKSYVPNHQPDMCIGGYSMLFYQRCMWGEIHTHTPIITHLQNSGFSKQHHQNIQKHPSSKSEK